MDSDRCCDARARRLPRTWSPARRGVARGRARARTCRRRLIKTKALLQVSNTIKYRIGRLIIILISIDLPSGTGIYAAESQERKQVELQHDLAGSSPRPGGAAGRPRAVYTDAGAWQAPQAWIGARQDHDSARIGCVCRWRALASMRARLSHCCSRCARCAHRRRHTLLAPTPPQYTYTTPQQAATRPRC